MTCIWPDGVLIRKAMPGPMPAGTVTCISMEMLRWWQEMANSGGVLKGGCGNRTEESKVASLRADHNPTTHNPRPTAHMRHNPQYRSLPNVSNGSNGSNGRALRRF